MFLGHLLMFLHKLIHPCVLGTVSLCIRFVKPSYGPGGLKFLFDLLLNTHLLEMVSHTSVEVFILGQISNSKMHVCATAKEDVKHSLVCSSQSVGINELASGPSQCFLSAGSRLTMCSWCYHNSNA